MPESPKRLGEFFESYKFTNEERLRLAGLASSGGLPSYILSKYATTTKAYREVFQKKEKIAGFRPGTPAYDKQAIPRIIKRLKETTGGDFKFFWELYRTSAITYVIEELPSLNSLLLETAAPANTEDTIEVLKTVCSSASEFGVSPDDIKKLYEAWWIPRIDSLEQLLPLCAIQDEARIQKRQSAKLVSELDNIKTAIKEVTDRLSAHVETTAEAEAAASVDREKISEIETLLQDLSKRMAELPTVTDVDSIAKSLDERISKLNERLKPLEQIAKDGFTAKDLKAELKKSSDESRSALTKYQEISSASTKALKEEIGSRLNEIETQIASNAKELSKKRDVVASVVSTGTTLRYKSPLSAVLGSGPTPNKITHELDFINSWVSTLSRSHGVAVSFEQAVAYHCAYLANAVVVSELSLIRSWIDCLGWKPYTMHAVASPTWTSEEDWEAGARHLFAPHDGKLSPRILIIHNYDVGLSDCYLAPSLLLWSLHAEEKGLSKIFLVPSQQGQSPCHQVLEHAVHIGESDYLATRDLSFREGIRIPEPIRKEIPIGVDPRLATQWLSGLSKISFDFTSIEKSLSLSLSQLLKTNFSRTASLATKYFSDPFATGIAMHHQVLPWIRARHGESSYSEVGAFLKQLEVRY